MTQTTRGTASNYDVLIVGGGVIGLSLAWELAQHDAKVCVVDRGLLGQEASWAGAGMVPPGPDESHWPLASPYEQLEGLSQALHSRWHAHLLELTGIDNEYRRCGSLQVALSATKADELDQKVARWQQLGIEANKLDLAEVGELEPALANPTLANSESEIVRAYHLPAEAQIRNPRHLRALIAACEATGVDLRPNTPVHDFEMSAHRIQNAVTSTGQIAAQQFCITTGSWAGELVSQLGVELPVRPIRGQIALLGGPVGLLQRIINVGPRYLVPREDGRLLIGSTQEEVGFVKESTDEAIDDLRTFASALAPATAKLPLETSWSGLRPGTLDGLPYLGRMPQQENAWLATGHFRAGLQLSSATAVVMRAMLLGQDPPVDVSALGVDRKLLSAETRP